jgi:hypothetical protein
MKSVENSYSPAHARFTFILLVVIVVRLYMAEFTLGTVITMPFCSEGPETSAVATASV